MRFFQTGITDLLGSEGPMAWLLTTTAVGISLHIVSRQTARREWETLWDCGEGRRLMLIAARHPDAGRRAQAVRLLSAITLPTQWLGSYNLTLSTAAAGSAPEPRAVARAVQRSMWAA